MGLYYLHRATRRERDTEGCVRLVHRLWVVGRGGLSSGLRIRGCRAGYGVEGVEDDEVERFRAHRLGRREIGVPRA